MDCFKGPPYFVGKSMICRFTQSIDWHVSPRVWLMASRRKSLILGILRLVVSLEPVSSGHHHDWWCSDGPVAWSTRKTLLLGEPGFRPGRHVARTGPIERGCPPRVAKGGYVCHCLSHLTATFATDATGVVKCQGQGLGISVRFVSTCLWHTKVLLPAVANTGWLQQAFEDVKVMMPASYFIDDGTFITRNRAFANFTFTALLLLDQDTGVPPQSLIDCIAHGTVPIIVGKHHKLDYTRYFSFAIAKFRDFSVEQAISFMLTAPADALYVYANSVKIVQEFFYMRRREQRRTKRVWVGIRLKVPLASSCQ